MAVRPGTWVRLRPAAALGATAAAVAGSVAVTVAVVAGPGPGLSGYVSEAGVTASSYAAPYRGGVLGLAGALLLLAVALPRPLRAVAALLGAGAAGAVLSALVNCSAGCPLPPFEATTAADLVHGGASIAAVACCVLAMLALALAVPAPPGAAVGRLAMAGVVLALPLSALVGLAMLTLGRGAVFGVLERLLLLVIVAWLAGTGLALARPGGGSARRGGPQNSTVAKVPTGRKPHRT